MSPNTLIFFCHIIVAIAAGAETNCSEPEPVGNAYRSWDGGVPNGYVNYTCLGPYYVLTAGNLSRWCDKDDNLTNYVYTGSPPVCTLKCEEPKQEFMSNITSKNGTSLGVAIYECIPPYNGTDNPFVTCSDKEGGWTNSVLDCADTVSKPENLIHTMEIQTTNNSTFSGCDSSSSTEPVTRVVVKTWLANITTTQERVEVVSVNITLKVNHLRPFVPCRTTSQGMEYSGTLSETQGKYRCKRWDSLEYNYTHDSSFPADSNVTAAENYCRQPNATFVDLNSTHNQPWCFTTSSHVRTDYCNVETCGKIHVAVMDQEQKQICSSVNLLDMLQVSTITITCTRVEGGRFPFGQRLKISFNSTCSVQGTVTLEIYNVSVRGREYIGGCGQAKTFWGLNLVSSNASIAIYQCHEGWHYRGGDLTATCNAFREWVGPDPSLCTDEPNRAEGALVNYTTGFQSNASLRIDASGMQGNCVTFDTTNNELNVTLQQPIEISEVVVTLERDINYTGKFSIRVETYMELNGSRKSCLKIQSWTNGTWNSECSLRPVTRNIRIWSAAPSVSVKICDVKVFGRPVKTPFPLECFQTSKGNDYKGKINMTTSGKTCQNWASHDYTDVSVFPDESQDSLGNNCRNPNPETRQRPWCFTSNSSAEWEYCPIFNCDDICRLREDGVNYKGEIDTTSSGRTCLNWFIGADTAKQFPFLQNSYFSGRQKPGNHCRNPIASQSRPWCYINQIFLEHQFCDIPECPHAGEMSSLWLDPNNYTSLPSWLFTKNTRECFFWYNTDMSHVGRSVAINASLWNSCGYGSGALCDFVDNNTTEWIYFRFNCSFDSTTTQSDDTSSPETTQTLVATTPKQSLFTKVKDSACRCVKIAVNAREELNATVARIRHELIVNTNLLSATKRKKVSAKDSRPYAIASGVLGIAALVTALTLLVSSDVINAIRILIRWFHAYISHVKSKNLK